MELSVAINLIENGVNKNITHQHWADLGSGEGLFTNALAELLGMGSTIDAIDTDLKALNKISFISQQVTLRKINQDFLNFELNKDSMDGILLANSFHFVLNKLSFVTRLYKCLKASGNIIIIEYDTNTANPWIPYPISFTALEKLANDAGFSSIQKLEEKPSILNRANIYSAVLKS